MITVGERIKDLLDEKGIQAKELAEYIGVGQSAMSLYLNNKRNIDIETLKKISIFLNESTDFLLTGVSPSEIKLNKKEKELLDLFNNMSEDKQLLLLKLFKNE